MNLHNILNIKHIAAANGIKLLVACSIAAVFIGCYKDKGNYTYQEINDISIEMPDTTQIRQGATANIQPVINQEIATDESRLKYEWTTFIEGSTNGADSTVVVLSTQRNLTTPINLPALDDYYTLNYKVKDTVTGITYRRMMKMLVTTDYQSGLVILEQAGGANDLSFINTRDNTSFHNLYASANPANPLPASAYLLQLQEIPKVSNSIAASTLFTVLSKSEGFIITFNTFKYEANYSALFATKPATIQPQAIVMNEPPNMLTINAGKLYKRFLSREQLLFGDAYTVSDGLGYSLAPYIAKTPYSSVFFDEANHRFLQEVFGALGLNPIISQDWYAFDPNNIDKKMLAMKLGYYGASSCVFKNSTNDSCFLYGLSYGSPNFYDALDNCPDIHQSPDFLFANQRNQLYYAAGNKLYLYDITTREAAVIYSFDAGEIVTTLEMDSDEKIAVATYGGGSGTIYTFDLDYAGALDGGSYKNKFTGFGKILSLKYKK